MSYVVFILKRKMVFEDGDPVFYKNTFWDIFLNGMER